MTMYEVGTDTHAYIYMYDTFNHDVDKIYIQMHRLHVALVAAYIYLHTTLELLYQVGPNAHYHVPTYLISRYL